MIKMTMRSIEAVIVAILPGRNYQVEPLIAAITDPIDPPCLPITTSSTTITTNPHHLSPNPPPYPPNKNSTKTPLAISKVDPIPSSSIDTFFRKTWIWGPVGGSWESLISVVGEREGSDYVRSWRRWWVRGLASAVWATSYSNRNKSRSKSFQLLKYIFTQLPLHRRNTVWNARHDNEEHPASIERGCRMFSTRNIEGMFVSCSWIRCLSSSTAVATDLDLGGVARLEPSKTIGS